VTSAPFLRYRNEIKGEMVEKDIEGKKKTGGEGNIPHNRDDTELVATPRISCCFQHLTTKDMISRNKVCSNINSPIHQLPYHIARLFFLVKDIKRTTAQKGIGRSLYHEVY